MGALDSAWAVRKASEAQPASLEVLRGSDELGHEWQAVFLHAHEGPGVGACTVHNPCPEGHPLPLFVLSNVFPPPALVPLKKCKAQVRGPDDIRLHTPKRELTIVF